MPFFGKGYDGLGDCYYNQGFTAVPFRNHRA